MIDRAPRAERHRGRVLREHGDVGRALASRERRRQERLLPRPRLVVRRQRRRDVVHDARAPRAHRRRGRGTRGVASSSSGRRASARATESPRATRARGRDERRRRARRAGRRRAARGHRRRRRRRRRRHRRRAVLARDEMRTTPQWATPWRRRASARDEGNRARRTRRTRVAMSSSMRNRPRPARARPARRYTAPTRDELSCARARPCASTGRAWRRASRASVGSAGITSRATPRGTS